MRNNIMQQIGNDFDGFKSDSLNIQDMSQELQDKTDRIKELIDHYDEISEQLEKAEKKYEEKAKALFDSDKIKQMRDSIAKIKKDLFGMNTQIGVIRGHVVQQQVHEGGDAFEMYKNAHSNKEEPEEENSYDFN